MRWLESFLTRRWYSDASPSRVVQYASEGIAKVVRERRMRTVPDALSVPVPVIVVGNITVGGTGKTPLIVHLVQALSRRGLSVAVVSRGYGGKGPFPQMVNSHSSSHACGDEPCLLHQKTGVSVVVGPDRIEACELLLRQGVPDVILSDDGMQHYRLPRLFEIVVVDGKRQFGNRLMLPFGPLREPLSQLACASAIVINGARDLREGEVGPPIFEMNMVPGDIYKLGDRSKTFVVSHKLPVAVAGIGNPERFFATLESLGIRHEVQVFPDHHDFRKSDFDDIADRQIIMTEKDAVKVDPTWFHDAWVLPVSAAVSSELTQLIVDNLQLSHSPTSNEAP